MKIQKIMIHNYRSILEVEIEVFNYSLLVGSNNSGKSSILNAIRLFYDDDKWTKNDFPKITTEDDESWVQLTFLLNDTEWKSLEKKYKNESSSNLLTLRRYFKSDNKKYFQEKQSNIFALLEGKVDDELFYNSKNISTAKVGQVLYIPASTTIDEQTKTTGPSPMRNILNYLLNKAMLRSQSFITLKEIFDNLNIEAKNETGFLSEILKPLNDAFSNWNIKFDLTINSITAEDISKIFVKHNFVDSSINSDNGFELDRYGHGFQRLVIYELIRLATKLKNKDKLVKKEFNPDFTLLLIDEPEAFLHPGQQESFANNLRQLGDTEEEQVIIVTHSPIFVGKAANEIKQIVRVQRKSGITKIFQPKGDKINEIFKEGLNLLEELKKFVENTEVAEVKKKKARELIQNPPTIEIAEQEENFRYQLWLDGERAQLFFADQVLLVEGTTEKVLFNYLLTNQWHGFFNQNIYILDVLGKYNFHRFMNLLKVYGIYHGVILDGDNNKDHHQVINNFVDTQKNDYTLAKPVKFIDCLETFLDLSYIKSRGDKKPIEIMKAIIDQKISIEKLHLLKIEFCKALNLDI
ncbi:AAA family ATPase [Silvanigrella paludirubra]|uniref:AAA family ATPase n=1 Tax=Silvanigrella paludirubra TaxID=2499159 RepID=A0A6N6VR67_9BACT|nr:AAA family ATPase [Silvanigrella paludirubra]KAB8037852.1 AAA family ATPase [Silvanigrella paludirubra]